MCLFSSARSVSLEPVRPESFPRRYFHWILIGSIVFCFSDIFAALFRGKTFAGIDIIIYASNMAYLLCGFFIGYMWLQYSVLFMYGKPPAGKLYWILSRAPLALGCLLMFATPWTRMIFFVDENHLYNCGPMIGLHWAFSFFYLIVVTYLAFRQILREKKRYRRKELYPLLYFSVAPFITSAIQLTCYGTTLIQIGFTISAILVYFSSMNRQVLTDDTTQINNRYMEDELISTADNEKVFVIMSDVDHFKRINDTCGHLAGDKMLFVAAQSLRNACAQDSDHVCLGRYGGDEFVVTGKCPDEQFVLKLLSQIDRELVLLRENKDLPVPLELSIGWAIGKPSDLNDLRALFNEADQNMYHSKQRREDGSLPEA